MRIRYIALSSLAAMLFASCQKNTMSKIPYISLIRFEPQTVMKANVDTCFFYFSLVDGDADIAGPGDSISQIYLIDSRDTTVIMKTPFPDIDVSIEDPKKGISGECVYFPDPRPVPRPDSLHTATGDTLYYILYIKDRAGNKSNEIVTPTFIIKP
ncbi:MAG: hypothetical protein K0Q79_1853 [Flavipsychrobacter sp.]|nr:hypothetical protein [Flavipsychrobacter sp.]